MSQRSDINILLKLSDVYSLLAIHFACKIQQILQKLPILRDVNEAK